MQHPHVSILLCPPCSKRLDADQLVLEAVIQTLVTQELMEVFFTRSFYKHVLSIPVDFEDLQSIDLQYYRFVSTRRPALGN